MLRFRPRLTLARLALAGAGLAIAAGIGVAVVPHVISGASAAATVPQVSATSTTPAPTPAAGARGAKGAKGTAAAARLARQTLRRRLVALVVTQTGDTRPQVLAQLKAGKSLDDIAGGKAQAVRDAELAAITKRLDAARAEGKVTQAQENRRLALAGTRITEVMAATPHHKAAPAATSTPTAA